MPDDAQNLARWTVPAKAALAPIAPPAREIDFSNNAPANQARIGRRDNLSDKFVPGYTGEAVVTLKQFKIGVAYATTQETDYRIAFRSSWPGNLPDRDTMLFKVDRKHAG